MHFLPTFSPSKMQFSSDHSLFTTVQSDDDSWFDAGTKQFFDSAAGGSTHSPPLSEADLTYSPPLPSCSWSPPLPEADLTCSSPVPCSWSPPLSEADRTCSSPVPCSWSPPLSEADLTCSSPLPCSWSPPPSEAGLPYSSPPPAVDRLPFPVGLPRSSTPFLATDLLYLQHNSPQTRQSTDIPCSRSLTQPRQAEKWRARSQGLPAYAWTETELKVKPVLWKTSDPQVAVPSLIPKFLLFSLDLLDTLSTCTFVLSHNHSSHIHFTAISPPPKSP